MQNPSINIPDSFLTKWQNIADLLAKIMNVPAALIMKSDNEFMEVFISSRSDNNPYHAGDREHWHGLYCETVIKSRKELLVPNALKDETWMNNPDIKLGMIAYLGIPINYPDKQPFGTLCVLDAKENEFSSEYKALLYQFKNVIELDLALIQSLSLNPVNGDADVIFKLKEQNEEYLSVNEELTQSNYSLLTEREKLFESEKQFRLLVDNAPDAIFIQTDWKFAYVNRKGLELFGADDDQQLIGTSVMNRFHPDFHQKIKERIVGLNKKKQIQKLNEQIYLKLDGTPVHVETSGIPYKFDGMDGALVFVRNITERKNADQKLMHWHKLMEYIIKHDPNAITVFDDQLNFIFVSDRFLTDYNISRKDVIGKHHYEVFPDIPEKWKQVHQRSLKGEILRKDEDVFNRLDGSVDYTSWECRPWYREDDSIGGIIIYTEVITERKKAELQLKEQTEEYYSLYEEYKTQNEEISEAKEKIEKSEEKFRKAILTNPDAITINRLEDGLYVSANEGFYKTFEYSEKEIVGVSSKHIKIWHKPRQRNEYKSILEKTGRIENLEAKFVTKSGKVLDCLVSSAVIEFEGEKHTINITKDISPLNKIKNDLVVAKEKAEENEQKFRSFFNRVADAIFIFDPETYKILEANEATSKTYGYSRDDLIGMSCLKFSAEIEKSKKVANEISQEGQAYVNIRHHKKKDGTDLFVQLQGYRIVVNNQPISFSVCHDVTETLKSQQDLKSAKEKAEEASRLKTEFLNNMSHEIRTPMNGIIGFSEMLSNEDISNEKRRYYTRIIQNSSIQLLRIIDDILEISTLETKQEKLVETEFCLNDLLMELFSIFNLKSKERNIPLYLKKQLSDSQSYLISDKTKLSKIISNLLENALKFTNEGFVEFGYTVENDLLKIYVSDTGVGIDPKNHDLIFVRFSQEDKEISSKHGGLGLGLSISKENAELLGGVITLESEKGKGSTFFVSIPYKPVVKNPIGFEADFKENAIEKKTHTILIAEDEEVNYLFLEALFENKGKGDFMLIHAKNGKEAVDLCIEGKNIDLVLMDIKMPVMNGHEATEKIKTAFPDLPVIAQTAYSVESDRQLAIRHGCDDFLSKPIRRDKLFELMNKYLKKE